MKRTAVLVAALALTASAAVADINDLPQAKQQELAAQGITEWSAGQNSGSGPVLSALDEPIRLPAVNNGRDTATMQYDDGSITALPTIFGQIYGNQFSEGVGGVQLDTVTLNSFSFYFAEDSIADTNLFFQPASPAATAGLVNARASVNIGGLVNAGSAFTNLATINVINQTALGTTGGFNDTFYLGAWCLNANTVVPVDNETIGLATNGPGFKGYTAASGTGAVAFAAQPFNAVLRANVTSPNQVPVELMSFEAN
jgi:hypothetical protein